jgi:heptosyltransferase-2
MCGAGATELVSMFDGVHDVIPVNDQALFRGNVAQRTAELSRLWFRLAGSAFDDVYLLHPDPRYKILLASVRARRVHALTRARHGKMNPIPGRYFGDEFARLLDNGTARGPAADHYALADLRAKLPAPASGPRIRRRVALVPGGARNVLREDPLRRWPVEQYARVATALAERGHDVALIGDRNDAWVRPYFAETGAADHIGAHSVTETLSLLNECDLVISHDTGPMHLARLVRTPLLALFGPTIPRQVLGDDKTTVVLWGGEELACRPCFDGREFASCSDNVCMKDISVAQVMERADEMLR